MTKGLNLHTNKIIYLYTQEVRSAKSIGKEFNCSHNSITYILKKNNIKIRSVFFRYPQKTERLKLDDNKIKDLYINKKMSITKIGKIVGCSAETVHVRLKKMGVKDFRGNKIRIKDKKSEIIKSYLDGQSYKEIAMKHDTNIFIIQDRLKSWGVKIRTMSEIKIDYYKHNIHKRKINLEPFKKEITKMYKKGFNCSQIACKFDVSLCTILSNLNNWGVEIRKNIYGSYKGGHLSDDGHKVRSSAELYISNWLHHNRIFYVYEKRLGVGSYKCDFYIIDSGIYLEYFGLMHINKYREKTKKKLEIYKNLGLTLLPIFPHDDIQEKLRPLLKYSKSQKSLDEFQLIFPPK